MLLNAKTAISTSAVVLVPYSKCHVPRYHDWMKDPEIRELTASEPLTLEEEYAMQRSWRQDPDKLTFIVCLPLTDSNSSLQEPGQIKGQTQTLPRHADTTAHLLGDINLFLHIDDGEEGVSEPQLTGEIELMIAEKTNHRRGFGKSAVLSFLRYIVDHEEEILDEFVRGDDGARAAMWGDERPRRFSYLGVKIGQTNTRSLALFEGVRFERVSDVANYFGEFELRRGELGREVIDGELEGFGVRGYVEVGYERDE